MIYSQKNTRGEAFRTLFSGEIGLGMISENMRKSVCNVNFFLTIKIVICLKANIKFVGLKFTANICSLIASFSLLI